LHEEEACVRNDPKLWRELRDYGLARRWDV
jgi:hypothetical protein